MDKITKWQLETGRELDEYNLRDIKLEKDELSIILGKIYEDIGSILKEYCDLREDYYTLISLWVIGTYIHKSFETYPYLFINAMRGSGKTRLLKLIAALSNKGDVIGSLKESVLFRTPPGTTICLDEFESIGNKENQALRELLNAGYKKGMKIKRMKKVKKLTGEDFEVEVFEPYTPICMANIWGIEEVLGDRSVTMVLEKSPDPYFNLIMEDFGEKPEIKDIKARLEANLVQLCSYFGVGGYIERWNNYIKQRYRNTSTFTTFTTQTTQTTQLKPNILTFSDTTLTQFFNRIHDSKINGRNLELFLPLFLIARFINEQAFDNILTIASNITKERREEEMVESKDVAFIDFISQRGLQLEFVSIKKVTTNFRMFLGDDEMEEKWVNTRWIGRALKRLNLIKEKRRVREGIEVILDTQKAIEKLKNFKIKE